MRLVAHTPQTTCPIAGPHTSEECALHPECAPSSLAEVLTDDAMARIAARGSTAFNTKIEAIYYRELERIRLDVLALVSPLVDRLQREQAELQQPLKRLWAHWHAEAELDNAIFGIFGFCDAWLNDDALWPFTGITYDEYDNSFELRGIKSPDWLPTPEQWAAMWALGFGHCWLCYEDCTERHCTPTVVGNQIDKHCAATNDKHRTVRERKRAEAAEAERDALRSIIEKVFARHSGFYVSTPVTGTELALRACRCGTCDFLNEQLAALLPAAPAPAQET